MLESDASISIPGACHTTLRSVMIATPIAAPAQRYVVATHMAASSALSTPSDKSVGVQPRIVGLPETRSPGGSTESHIERVLRAATICRRTGVERRREHYRLSRGLALRDD